MLGMVLLVGMLGASGTGAPAAQGVAVDGEGVLRWHDTGAEVALFGVNYYPPHWANYRDLKQLGVSFEETIDRDLTHFVRMGLDALRLHVFDREISDPHGNLVENDHLRILDYLVAQAKARGLYTVLTPIAWWGSPNPNNGFSNRFPMQDMVTDPKAWAVESRYLTQFLNHVNPHTGHAYKDEPAVPVLELINEPQYPANTPDETVVAYVNTLARAVRDTGCTKPLFYNAWGNRHAVVRDAELEGATFGWYPSGLVAGRSLWDNFLPAVNDYRSMRSEELQRKAKIVYEFDAADVPGSYIYPAMGRAFRSGGAQIATQFQYDPLPVAPFNMGWHTHYLNLVYVPNQAVSFLIANEAFHRLPRLETYGAYPKSNRFGPFRVSYEDDLSEMVTERAFLYSNDTATSPPSPEKLERIVGCGSSPIVDYEGTGGYFLDRLGDGLWRLEVYPDAVWVADPYGQASFEREVSRVIWRERAMTVRLPDLGPAFRVTPLNAGNDHEAASRDGRFEAWPGIYVLRRAGLAEDAVPSWDRRLGMREFVAPPVANEAEPVVWHEPLYECAADQPLRIQATVAASQDCEGVVLEILGEGSAVTCSVPLQQQRAYHYRATLDPSLLPPNRLAYRIVLHLAGETHVFPEDGGRWEVQVFEAGAPVVVFDADRHGVWMRGEPRHSEERVPGRTPEGRAWRITAPDGFGPPPSCLSMRHRITNDVRLRGDELAACDTLRLRLRAVEAATNAVEIVVLENDGTPWGATVALGTEWRDIDVPLSDLRHFAHWDGGPPNRGGESDALRPAALSAVNLCFGAWLYPDHAAGPHAIEVERIELLRSQ